MLDLKSVLHKKGSNGSYVSDTKRQAIQFEYLTSIVHFWRSFRYIISVALPFKNYEYYVSLSMLVLFFIKQSSIFSENVKRLEITTRHEICTYFKKGRQWTQNRLLQNRDKKTVCHTLMSGSSSHAEYKSNSKAPGLKRS